MKKTKAKKMSIILALIVFVVSFSVIIYATGNIITNPTTITFVDSNLYESMKKQLKSKKIAYNENDTDKTIEVSEDDVLKITELNLQGVIDAKISNLSGLESFTNLKILNLSGNAITNANAISELKNINDLNFSDNPINDSVLETIAKLTSLEKLNISNTQLNGDQLENLKTLSNLKELKIAKNNISTVESISTLTGITSLDISVNKSFTDFKQLTVFTNLIVLNVSGTGITTFSGSSVTTEHDGIEMLSNLEKLYAQDNLSIVSNGLNSIYATYKNGTKNVPYLNKIKVLNLSSLGASGKRPTINFSNFAKLTTLEELHLASNDISSLSGIAKLENLKYIDLANNKIQSSQLPNFIQKTTVNGESIVQTENTLKATKIDLRGNQIIDVSVFADYPGNITWLDLSENHVYDVEPLSKHSFNEGLFLQKQDITFGLYKKTAAVNHYIILPSIFRYSKAEGKFIYSSDVDFKFEGVTLNPDYTDPNQYNVIIDYKKTKNDTLTAKISGGVADGTVLNFSIGTQGDVSCYIDSLLFKDENLDSAIEKELRATNNIKYLERIPKIININQDAISKITKLDLQHTGSSADTKIKDLSGLENFYNLTTLYLQNNDIKTIDPLTTCVKLNSLYLSNNSNLGNNNSAIEKMTVLGTLDLSNTGMTNIDSINTLTEYFTSKKRTTTLISLNISDNKLNNIEGIENITSLQSLSLANDKLNDEKISKLDKLTNLSTLNINGNEIENIDIISSLDLKYLYFNNNQVKSLQPIQGKVFYDLEFAGNRIKDISPLSGHRTINNLRMDNNQIEDTSVLSGISMSDEQTLSITGQKIVRVLEKGSTGTVQLELPQIFKDAKNSSNKLYTDSEFITSNCTLDSTGNSVSVDVDKLSGDIAQVEIYGGKAHGTILTIAPALEGKITYNPSIDKKTNKNVTATISFNRSDVTITNNDGKNTYTFENNGEFSFDFVDKYGFEGTEKAIVQNIDKEAPVETVTKEVKNKQVIVTITVNEKVQDVYGWTSSEFIDGKMTLTKTFESDSKENVNLTDEAGNVKVVNIQVKIDKTAPTIKGIEEGKKYNSSVTPVIQDDSEITVILTKNGTIVENYKVGDTINGAGKYVLTATDTFGNTTKVSFEISISDIITSKTQTIDESKLIVKNIKPGMTVWELINNIENEMTYEIIDSKGNKLLNTSRLATGQQIKMQNDKKYTIIVWGDLTGSGTITTAELARISKIAAKIITPTELEKIVIDVNSDGNIKTADIAAISKYAAGIK
mgnify:FL=1